MNFSCFKPPSCDVCYGSPRTLSDPPRWGSISQGNAHWVFRGLYRGAVGAEMTLTTEEGRLCAGLQAQELVGRPGHHPAWLPAPWRADRARMEPENGHLYDVWSSQLRPGGPGKWGSSTSRVPLHCDTGPTETHAKDDALDAGGVPLCITHVLMVS